MERRANKKSQSNLGRAASLPLTAENGLTRCACNTNCRRVLSLSRRYATSTPQYHRCTQFPTTTPQNPIGYNWMHHIYPSPKCPFPFDELHPSNTPILRLYSFPCRFEAVALISHSPPQTASGYDQPFFTIHPPDRQTDRLAR